MSGFSAEWLARREPHDTGARNPAVLDAVVGSLKSIEAVRLVDLACGTGSTLRALAPRLPAQQHWRLIDSEPDLLARAATSAATFGVGADAIRGDLNTDMVAALDGPLDMVVTSALLDLVSESWLERLAAAMAARLLPFYAALNYDGRVELAPADPEDAAIIAAVNRHQRTDKGFGSALGPTAATWAMSRLESLGYAVVHGPSDWILGPRDRDIQLDVISGWAEAALAMGLSQAATAGWLVRRRAFVAAGHSSIRVGHSDFWARHTATR
jgi:SAM-dependent methyltransferase